MLGLMLRVRAVLLSPVSFKFVLFGFSMISAPLGEAIQREWKPSSSGISQCSSKS